MKLFSKTIRGDTLVEVMFSVGIFGIISVSAISLMNRGLNTAQTALETTMARNEIDAQAEAIRFIHAAYAAESTNSAKEYEKLWQSLTDGGSGISGHAINYDNASENGDNSFLKYYPSKVQGCDDAYTYGTKSGKSFVVNTHNLNASEGSLDLSKVIYSYNPSDSSNKVKIASTYPRLIFTNGTKTTDEEDMSEHEYKDKFYAAEGIWVTSVKSNTMEGGVPQYYDFYIRTCWNSPGRGTPMTISTTIRLYNPDI